MGMSDSAEHPHTSTFTSLPATSGGRWSGWLTLVMVASVIVTIVIQENLEGDGGTAYRVARLIPVTVTTLSGIGAFVLSLRAVFGARERSIVVWIALAIGFLITMLVFAEVTGLME